MARPAAAPRGAGPNRAFRELRGDRSPGEFAAAVRRAAREIGERVACDARYIGRVESGEIRCPNYAYERVFIHMFPGRTLIDLGFEPRQAVRGRRPRTTGTGPGSEAGTGHRTNGTNDPDDTEESDVLRRAFMTGGPAALASLTSLGQSSSAALDTAALHASPGPLSAGRPGEREAAAVRQAVRDIRLLDDEYGADALYRPAGDALRAAYLMLDAGSRRQSVSDRLHTGAGELAISVGWLAHDSGRFAEARSHYAEALATARVSGDPGLEAHAFCNTAFLARDAGRPREAVRAAEAGQQAARQLPSSSPRLLSLLALREAGGWAGMGDRSGCIQALARARRLFGQGPREADPEWMTFFGEAEMASLEAQCWAALGDFGRAAEQARRAVEVQLRQPHFVRNLALFSAELADHLARHGEPEEATAAGHRALALLNAGARAGTGAAGKVRSTRVKELLGTTAERLTPYLDEPAVASFRTAAPDPPGAAPA
ncbi:tetratricopeptide repeat protein [Streptomyces sp. 6N223]|uniref:tetratricopeptide repeat protein n=1 Tax=Streptomyces sp. 6N223 TaxID=3457412 RepID=UPI003FD25EB8